MVSPSMPGAPETVGTGVGAEYNIFGGVAGGTGREKEPNRTFVSRTWTGSRPVAALGYLLGGGALRGTTCGTAGVTAPEETWESVRASAVLGRGTGGFLRRGGKI